MDLSSQLDALLRRYQSASRLKTVTYHVNVKADHLCVWQSIAQFGNIGEFHDNVVSSDYINGQNHFGLGSERYCEFKPQGGKKPVVKERIISFNPGRSYTIDFYHFENMPMKYMFITLSINSITSRESILKVKIEYRTKPGFLSGLVKKRMLMTGREILLGYKHVVETGERNAPMAELKKKYASH